jgi:hypothetical protein
MTKDKWTMILGNILDNFQVLEHEKEFIEEEGGIDLEYIVFMGPLGKMRLEFIEKPIVLDKKTNYSNRIGSDTGVEYVYSDTEKSSRLEAYKWSDDADDWVEMEAGKFL